MILFETTGKENTEAALRAAVETAVERGIKYIVFSSSAGYTAETLMGIGIPEGIQPVMVTLAYSSNDPDKNPMKDEMRAKCREAGIEIVTAGHALSGVERGLRNTFGGINPAEIIAYTLKMFGAGTKVAVECATMAADAGVIPAGEPVIAMGGTSFGCDTALIMKASYSAKVLETKIEEFICKPQI